MMANRAQERQPTNFAGLSSVAENVEGVILTRLFQCECGQDGLKISAGKWEGEDSWLDPVAFECTTCGNNGEIFNSQKHGYDGLLCGSAACMQSSEKVSVNCPNCPSEHVVLRADIFYNIDYSDPDELEELPDEFRSRLEDLFDALSLRGQCGDCTNEIHIGDWELA